MPNYLGELIHRTDKNDKEGKTGRLSDVVSKEELFKPFKPYTGEVALLKSTLRELTEIERKEIEENRIKYLQKIQEYETNEFELEDEKKRRLLNKRRYRLRRHNEIP